MQIDTAILINIQGGNKIEERFPVISFTIRYIHIIYLVRKLFI